MNVLFHGYFEDAVNKDGEPGLPITVDVFRVPKGAAGPGTKVVPNAAATETVGAGLGGGHYHYLHTDDNNGVFPGIPPDTTLYDYKATFKSVSAAVVSKHVPAIRWDAAEAWSVGLATLLSGVLVGDILTAALKKFVTVDTGEINAVFGSVAQLAQCNASGFPAGSIEYTLTIVDPGAIPIEGASVWISTDVAMTNIIWRGVTDAFGVARDIRNMKPWLDAGLYQFWVQDENWTGGNPTAMVVS